MRLASTWLTTILGGVVVRGLMAEGRPHPSTSADFNENPELHMYMDKIDICLP